MPRKKRKPIPPCPDPDRYILVETEDGFHWRLKRGSLKPAHLNDSLAANSRHTPITNAAASRIMGWLEPYLRGLDKGRLHAVVGGKLKKALNRDGRMHFDFLEGCDIQKRHPLGELVKEPVWVEAGKGRVRITLAVTGHTVKRHSKLVSGYYFTAVLLFGNAERGGGLRVRSTESGLYAFDAGLEEACVLSLKLPPRGVPWMVLFKASCLEGNELALHARHYGMKVVKTGGFGDDLPNDDGQAKSLG